MGNALPNLLIMLITALVLRMVSIMIAVALLDLTVVQVLAPLDREIVFDALARALALRRGGSGSSSRRLGRHLRFVFVATLLALAVPASAIPDLAMEVSLLAALPGCP